MTAENFENYPAVHYHHSGDDEPDKVYSIKVKLDRDGETAQMVPQHTAHAPSS